MAKQFETLNPKLINFISKQHIFFTASATADSRINLSPREIEAFRVVDESCILYLDLTGSGNETSAHLLADGRLTIMFCAFSGPPNILRLYGKGEVIGWHEDEFKALIDQHFDGEVPLGARKIVRLSIDLVQTSCGYGVPLFDHQGERPSLINWAENKGPEGIKAYWQEKNLESMDGLPTGLEIPAD